MIDGPVAFLLVLGAGLAAGTINAIVGSGSLITFPTLVFLGFPPLVANVSNTVGLVPGSITGAIGYRRELRGQLRRAVPLVLLGGLGGLTGAFLLLTLPPSAFETIVVACTLVAIQPRLSRWIAARRAAATAGTERRIEGGPLLLLGTYLTGVYGGYFGAAQGVILIAILAILIQDDLQRLNGLKNAIAGSINGVAAVVFLLVAPVDFLAAATIAVGSTIGGFLGASIGRRLPPDILRGVIIVVGVTVAIRILMQ